MHQALASWRSLSLRTGPRISRIRRGAAQYRRERKLPRPELFVPLRTVHDSTRRLKEGQTCLVTFSTRLLVAGLDSGSAPGSGDLAEVLTHEHEELSYERGRRLITALGSTRHLVCSQHAERVRPAEILPYAPQPTDTPNEEKVKVGGIGNRNAHHEGNDLPVVLVQHVHAGTLRYAEQFLSEP